MIYALALIPSIVLLIYIYVKDRKEKEPLGLLIKCFLWGIVIIIPVVVVEMVLDMILEEFCIPGSVIYAAFDGFVVAGCTEEIFKYIVLKKRTWKSEEFNSSFDGIVYAVFVSLGFATFENLLYVLDSGLSTAILRMFTAVPGHAYDAVLMGYFYSKAKKASIQGDKSSMRRNKRRALMVPILFHGIYDCLISFEEEVVGENILLMGILFWIVVVILEFVISLRVVRKASKEDELFELAD